MQTQTENAIHAWVVAGSELAADHVIWWGHRGPVPSGTYISMRIIEIGRVSSDCMVTESAGAEIVHRVAGPRQPTLELTCFAGTPLGSGSTTHILERVITAIKLPSVRALLRAGNVGIGPRGRVRELGGIRSTMFDPRAIVEIGLHTTFEVSETGFAIERVEVVQETAGVVTWVPKPPE